MRLVFATNNAHKVEEVRAILANSGIEVLTLREAGVDVDPPEDADNFADNAIFKARMVFELTSVPCVADDSGLVVDALDGAPGVHSKRYSEQGTDTANNDKLLHALHALHDVTDRRAAFVAVVALVTDRFEGTVEGRCPGTILPAPRGAGGFGYDPIFSPDAHPGVAMAELSMAQKNAISHRGRAFAQLAALMRQADLAD